MAKRILVLGSTGFLGSHFESLGNSSLMGTSEPLSIFPLSTKIRDLNLKDLQRRVKKFDIVINCIALSSLEVCEQKQPAAEFLNTHLPEAFALACNRTGAKFVHISSDAVYGDIDRPRTEESVCMPKSYYGVSKLMGEDLAIKANPSTLICRTNFFGYSPKQNSLLDFIVGAGSNRLTMQGFSDVFFNTLYVKELVSIVIRLLQTDERGVFNVMGSETVSKLEFARTVFKEFGYDPGLIQEAKASEQREFANLRNLDLSVDVSKLSNLLGDTAILKHSVQWAAQDIPQHYTIRT
jgi:dTDP-4-dehydrorhamnose reductase